MSGQYILIMADRIKSDKEQKGFDYAELMRRLSMCEENAVPGSPVARAILRAEKKSLR